MKALVKTALELFKRISYTPLVEVIIHRDALKNNLKFFQEQHAGKKVIPILKSNAYGHGIVEVAKVMQEENVQLIGIDSLYEARLLRNSEIRVPFLILGYTSLANILQNKLKGISFTIADSSQIDAISKSLKKDTSFHLKIDTGMHRQGIIPSQLDAVIAKIRLNPHIKITGAFSHLADADGDDNSYTLEQIEMWNNTIKKIKIAYPKLVYSHLSATTGSIFSDRIDANAIRLGIGLYGFATNQDISAKLSPALEMRTHVASVRGVVKGEKVGYNCTYTAPHDMRVAVIPVGYFEGVDRRLSNKGCVLIKDRVRPIVGRVSMNMISVDVTETPTVSEGDIVTVISSRISDPNSISLMARTAGTISYDLLVHIPQHLRRVVV